MKIVHIVGGDLTKGAHRGAYWLHKGLLEIGVDSVMLGPIPISQVDERIISTSNSKLDLLKDLFISKADSLLIRCFPQRVKGWSFSSGFFGRKLKKHPLIKNADIIHLHWIAKGPVSVRAICSLQKPIIWTFRDMWPFTGGCHYAMDCERYKKSCGRCPQLGSHRKMDLSSLVWKRKKKWLSSQIKIVGISDWIANCARESGLFKNNDVRMIPNCVDSEIFIPIQQRIAREALGISTQKHVVLTGAGNLESYWKGFDLFNDAVKNLNSENTLVIFFGNSGSLDLTSFPCETMDFGYLNDDLSMKIVYSAADVFVAPSRQEAFGKTLVEAMCCGTPVVCFDATGPKDIVEHKVTGYKAKPFEPIDLAEGIKWVLENSVVENLRKKSVGHAREFFAKERVAEKYLSLYEEVGRETKVKHK